MPVEAALPAAPPVTEGYDHINRYWDRGFSCHAAKILPGEYYVTTQGEMITTVLGSCVSACIRDRVLGIGGMNHFMLPHAGGDGSAAPSGARYGSYAMERLINEIIKHGGHRRHLEAKLFGGGQVLANMTDIGRRNIEFVRSYVAAENLDVVAEDLGDTYPRRVAFFPATGQVKMKKIVRMHNDTVIQRERRYRRELECDNAGGGVELF